MNNAAIQCQECGEDNFFDKGDSSIVDGVLFCEGCGARLQNDFRIYVSKDESRIKRRAILTAYPEIE